jgi:hypothetical protein
MQACTLALVLACLGNPSPASDRPVVQVPKSRARIEPTPAPAPELPTRDVELPSWNETAAPLDAPISKPSRPKLLRDGGPAIVIGSLMLAGTVAMVVGGRRMPNDEIEPGTGFALVITGGIGIPGGLAILAAGIAARVKFRRTDPDRAADSPPTGRAMHAAGAVLLSAGALVSLAGWLMLHEADTCFQCVGEWKPVEWGTTLGLGSAALVSGTALLIPSQVREARYRRWIDERSRQRATLRPSFRVGPQLGIAGRF